jgi:hypothetical protein
MNDDQPVNEPAHTIRLRGPCQLSWIVAEKVLAVARVKIPAAIQNTVFEDLPSLPADSFLLRRNFGKPAGLDGSQTLKLNFEGFQGVSRVHINRESENPILVTREDSARPSKFEISIQSLIQHNRLEIEFNPNAEKLYAGDIELVIETS